MKTLLEKMKYFFAYGDYFKNPDIKDSWEANSIFGEFYPWFYSDDVDNELIFNDNSLVYQTI